MAALMQLIEQHGLQVKWNTFETRYLTSNA